jgi:hypothetical protein
MRDERDLHKVIARSLAGELLDRAAKNGALFIDFNAEQNYLMEGYTHKPILGH